MIPSPDAGKIIRPADFLLADYELKAEYLTAHFSRMWTRFNFFLTIESALFAFSLNSDYAQYVWLLSIGGLVLALAWYFFGAADNYLVEIYRRPIENSYWLLRHHLGEDTLQTLPEGALKTWNYVGNRLQTEYYDWASGTTRRVRQNFFMHRWRSISVTELTVILPLFMLILWGVRIGVAYMAQ